MLAKVGGQEQGFFDQLAVKHEAFRKHGGQPADEPAAHDHEYGNGANDNDGGRQFHGAGDLAIVARFFELLRRRVFGFVLCAFRHGALL